MFKVILKERESENGLFKMSTAIKKTKYVD